LWLKVKKSAETRFSQRSREATAASAEAERGIALIEALAAIVITALMVALFLPIVSSNLSRWSISIARGERLDQVMRLRMSVGADISSLALIPAFNGAPDAQIWFRGDASTIVFVHLRTDISGPPHLIAVAYHVEVEGNHVNLVRRFGMLGNQRSEIAADSLSHPDAVFTGARFMQFSFLDKDGQRFADWNGKASIPSVIELSVVEQDARGLRRVLSFATTTQAPSS
jgi:hypothetical protein